MKKSSDVNPVPSTGRYAAIARTKMPAISSTVWRGAVLASDVMAVRHGGFDTATPQAGEHLGCKRALALAHEAAHGHERAKYACGHQRARDQTGQWRPRRYEPQARKRRDHRGGHHARQPAPLVRDRIEVAGER